jgi:hypothetical protein
MNVKCLYTDKSLNNEKRAATVQQFCIAQVLTDSIPNFFLQKQEHINDEKGNS